jgi:Ca2+-binding EF-hand superfamily protein
MNQNLKVELDVIFKNLDKDGNGFIDKEEFKNLLVSLGKDKDLSEEQWKLLFSLVSFKKN